MPGWDKLRIVTLCEGALGFRGAQALHGVLAFAAEHPSVETIWRTSANTVAWLEADQAQLEKLRTEASRYAVPHSVFHEPDLADRLTAVVLAPCPRAQKITRGLPLAGVAQGQS